MSKESKPRRMIKHPRKASKRSKVSKRKRLSKKPSESASWFHRISPRDKKHCGARLHILAQQKDSHIRNHSFSKNANPFAIAFRRVPPDNNKVDCLKHTDIHALPDKVAYKYGLYYEKEYANERLPSPRQVGWEKAGKAGRSLLKHVKASK